MPESPFGRGDRLELRAARGKKGRVQAVELFVKRPSPEPSVARLRLLDRFHDHQTRLYPLTFLQARRPDEGAAVTPLPSRTATTARLRCTGTAASSKPLSPADSPAGPGPVLSSRDSDMAEPQRPAPTDSRRGQISVTQAADILGMSGPRCITSSNEEI